MLPLGINMPSCSMSTPMYNRTEKVTEGVSDGVTEGIGSSYAYRVRGRSLSKSE